MILGSMDWPSVSPHYPLDHINKLTGSDRYPEPPGRQALTPTALNDLRGVSSRVDLTDCHAGTPRLILTICDALPPRVDLIDLRCFFWYKDRQDDKSPADNNTWSHERRIL